jgi:hypothetical protein
MKKIISVSMISIQRTVDPYYYTMKKYIDNQSLFFSSKKEKKYESRVELEYEIYDANFEMLADEDKNDFLKPKEQLVSAFHHIRRYKG